MATSVEQKSLNEAKPTHTAQDIGLIFIREYYTFLNKTPSHLHAFYNKDSLFVRGDEGTISETARGQEEIAKRIDECHFEDCKVLVTQVDSQLSANNGILVHVLGEMCNHSGSSQKFSQTFFLATQQNGYYVLNDIFRFLKDEVKIDYYSCEEEPFVQPEIVAKKEEDVTVVPPTSPIPTKIVKQQVEEQSNKPKTWANLTAVTAAATGSSTGTTSPELSAPVTPDIVSPVIQEAEKPVQLEIQEPEPANQKAVKVEEKNKKTKETRETEVLPQHKSQPRNKESTTQIFVKKVYDSVNEEQLRDAFSTFGTIKLVIIPRGRNCAFIEFTSPESVQKALTQHKVTLVTGNAVFAEERRYNNNNTPGRYPNKNAYNTFERRSNNNNNNHRRQGQPPRVNPVKEATKNSKK